MTVDREYSELWRRVKANGRRWLRSEHLAIKADEIDGYRGDCMHHEAQELIENIEEVRLVRRTEIRVEIDFDEKTIQLIPDGHQKSFSKQYKNDIHGINVLKKLDSDDTYFKTCSEEDGPRTA